MGKLIAIIVTLLITLLLSIPLLGYSSAMVVIIFVCFAVFLSGIIIYFVVRHMHNEKAKNSEFYLTFVTNGIEQITKTVLYKQPYHYDFSENLNSYNKYANFNYQDCVKAKLESNKSMYEYVKLNYLNWMRFATTYASQYNQIIESWNQQKELGVKEYIARYIDNEIYRMGHSFYESNYYRIVTLTWYYTSPKQRNKHQTTYNFTIDEINKLIEELEIKLSYKKTVKYQRSLMSSRLRYEILTRDKSTCQICGASAKTGAKLHVDHIIPVSKGGLTEARNLRVLCDACNLGKGAQMPK
ncbi:MAG: HNH endonuclease signature motif containing protein [Oscillospiraceae bacterium]